MIEKQLAHYLINVSDVSAPNLAKVGAHVYDGRIPAKVKPAYAIKLRKIAGGRSYNLSSEFEASQPIIEVEAMTRLPGGGYTLGLIMDEVRRAMNVYTAGPAQIGDTGDEVQIYGCQIVREGSEIPVHPQDASNGWLNRRSMDFQLTRAEVTTL